jgi:L-glyceraldehyde 3-phosphate reductase
MYQGLLTDKYLNGIPEGSRVSKPWGFLKEKHLTEEALAKVRALNDIAASRGQSLAQMALAWTLRDSRVTSALIGASSVAQIEDNVAMLSKMDFSEDELARIDAVLKS